MLDIEAQRRLLNETVDAQQVLKTVIGVQNQQKKLVSITQVNNFSQNPNAFNDPTRKKFN